MTNITNQASYNAAVTAIFSAPRKRLGVRKQSATSRDIKKPRNTAAVFIYGGPFELHASRTAGIMADRVWCYERGVLSHETLDTAVCQRIIELADQLRA